MLRNSILVSLHIRGVFTKTLQIVVVVVIILKKCLVKSKLLYVSSPLLPVVMHTAAETWP